MDSRLAILTLLTGLIGGLLACQPSFDVPEFPEHTESEGGALHAIRYETPFLCGDPDRPDAERGVPCPTIRPPDQLLSCDATGCHGGYDFSPEAAPRHLRGGEAPSCYTCHGEEWE